MIIHLVVVKAYAVMTLLSVGDEIWNINNPRPYPSKTYSYIQWEEKDFYTFKIEDKWVLRKYRKTDSNFKRKLRNKYWKKRK